MRTMVQNFLHLYTAAFQSLGPFDTIPAFASLLNFTELYQTTTDAYLTARGVGMLFIDEMWSVSSRASDHLPGFNSSL